MNRVLKKIVVGVVNASLCVGLLAAGGSAASPKAEQPQTLTVARYEIDGQVVIDEETVFQITPDGELLDGRGRAASPRFKLLRRVSVGLTNDGSLSHSVGAVTLFNDGDEAEGKLRLCRKSGGEWVTKKSRSYSTTSSETELIEFDYYVSRGDWRAELDVSTTDSNGVPGELLTVASNILSY